MNNLVEELSNKNGTVTQIMKPKEREKLARMRDFLCAEEEVYEKLDHYDIASMSDTELEGLLDLSFGDDPIELPDDVEDLLDDLRRDIGEEEDIPPHSGGTVSFFKKCQTFGTAASLFLALFFSGYVFMAPEDLDASIGSALQSVGSGELVAIDDITTVDPRNSAILATNLGSNSVLTAGLTFPSSVGAEYELGATVAVETPLLTASLDPLIYDEGIFSGPTEGTAGAQSVAGISVFGTVQSDPEQIYQIPQSYAGGWIGSVDSGLVTNDFSEQTVTRLQEALGGEIMASGVSGSDSRNVVVQVDGVELHIFSFTLSEGESVYTISRDTQVNPNIFSLINRALEENALINTATMGLNDRIVGIAARQGNQYALSELVYERARSSDALVYSNCPNGDLLPNLGLSVNSALYTQACSQAPATPNPASFRLDQ